jgi:DNA polymerase-1
VSKNRQTPNSDLSIFLTTLKSYVKKFGAGTIYVAWDKRLNYGETNFRQELMEGDYKAQRDNTKHQGVYDCIDIAIPMLESLGVKNMYPYNLEGDDVVAWLAHNLDGPNMIVTADNDMFQLVDSDNHLYYLTTKKVINPETFEKHVGVSRDAFLYYKSILGDKSDNIIGLDGFGKIKSKKLAENWDQGSKDLSADQMVIISKNLELIDLSHGYKQYEEEVNSYKDQLNNTNDCEFNMDRFKDYCEEYQLHQVLKSLGDFEDSFQGSRMSLLFNSYFDK